MRRRATDDAKHVACSSLIFKRVLQLRGSCLHLVEQAHVLDRDDGLVSEGLEECDLFLGEGPYLGPAHRKHANGFVLSHEWRRYNGPMAEPKRHRLSVRELVGRGKIVHMNCGSINERAPCGPAAPNRPAVEIDGDRSAMGCIVEPVPLS